jgi:hypothetical protein
MFRILRRNLFAFVSAILFFAFTTVYLHGCQSPNATPEKEAVNVEEVRQACGFSQPAQDEQEAQKEQEDQNNASDQNNEQNNQGTTPDQNNGDEQSIKAAKEQLDKERNACQSIDGLITALTLSIIPPNSYQGFIIDLPNGAPSLKGDNFNISEIIPEERTYLLDGDLAALEALKKTGLSSKDYTYIEPNFLYKIASGSQASLPPNDPNYPDQWNLKDINVEAAWPYAKGNGGVVAVMDTDIILSDEFNSDTFVPGYDAIKNQVVEKPSDKSTGKNPHGTNISGIIAQATNNGKGFAGIAPDAKIMPIYVLDKDGRGTASNILEGFKHAIKNGATVINCSFTIENDPLFNRSILEAILDARLKGIVVVAAAGNEGKPRIAFPASAPNLIAVSAHTYEGKKASYSNYDNRVDIFAPGGEGEAKCDTIDPTSASSKKDTILQSAYKKVIRRGNTEESKDKFVGCIGTSQATGTVSAGITLMQEMGIKDPAQIEKILIASSSRICADTSEKSQNLELDPESLASGNPKKVGRLNVWEAVKLARNYADPNMQDRIALAKHLRRRGFKFKESCACNIVYQETGVKGYHTAYKEIFGSAGFNEIRFIQVDHANRANIGWFQKDEFFGYEPSLGKLVDLSGYEGGKNFQLAEKYQVYEEKYKRCKKDMQKSNPGQKTVEIAKAC